MRIHESPVGMRQSGAVLATSLVFLLVLTLVAVIAMQSTVTDQKISTNIAYKTKTLEFSESPRPKAVNLMDGHTFYRGWTEVLAGSTSESEDFSGLYVVDKTEDLYIDNEDTEDPLDPSTLIKDMVYTRTHGSEAIRSDITIYRNSAHILSGHSAAMVAGYEGTGKAAAGSGSAVFFDIRSKGMHSATNAETVTSADGRVIVRN